MPEEKVSAEPMGTCPFETRPHPLSRCSVKGIWEPIPPAADAGPRQPGDLQPNGTVYDDATLIQIQRGEIRKLQAIIELMRQGSMNPSQTEIMNELNELYESAPPVPQEASTYPNSITCRERLKKLSFLITGNDYAFFSVNPQIEEALKVYVEAAAPQEAAPKSVRIGKTYTAPVPVMPLDEPATATDWAMRVAEQIVNLPISDMRVGGEKAVERVASLIRRKFIREASRLLGGELK